MKSNNFKAINENGVLAKIIGTSIYTKENASGTPKTKVRFVVEPLDPSVEIPNGSAITVDINQLKTNCNVNVDNPNINRFRGEVLEFDFYQLEEELVNGKKCEKEYTLVKSINHHVSAEHQEMSKKMQAIVDAGGVFQI